MIKALDNGYTNNLKRHIKSNHGTANGSFIKCDKCNLTLSVSTTLKSHYKKVHSNRDFIFQCDHCEKRFKSMQGYKDHLKNIQSTNLGVTYGCNQCEKSYAVKISLQRHMKLKHM